MRQIAIAVSLLLAGCVAEVAPPRVAVEASPPPVYVPAPPPPVVSVYVEPPLSEPAPIAVGWAPPPMLVESPPPPPFEGAVWVGGYWVWQGDWVWAHGHWVGAPRPNYVWVHPYYENRDGVVLFIPGHWSAPGVAFVPPPPDIHLSVEVAAAGVVAGPAPMGPNGCFVPAPPGSRAGIIVPAPIGTAPAVVTGAPPVVAVGMRINSTVNNTTIVRNNTVVNNTTNNITNVRNVTNITSVTIVAPASATANGQAVNTTAPAAAHLAAAQAAVVRAQAPEPASAKPIPSFVHGRAPARLPAAQVVNTGPQESKQTHSPQESKQTHSPQEPKQAHSPQPPAHAQAQAQAQMKAETPHAQAQANPSPGNARPASAPANATTAANHSAAHPEGARPGDAQFARTSNNKPADSPKHVNAPNPSAAKKADTAVKNKGEKKPVNKEERAEREKTG